MKRFGGVGTTSSVFSTASLFSYYASMTAFITLIKQFYYQFVPELVRRYINNKLGAWFKLNNSPTFTLVIEKYDTSEIRNGLLNHVYKACDVYLATKLKSTARSPKAIRTSRKESLCFKLAEGETFSEEFEGIKLQWCFISTSSSGSSSGKSSMETTKQYFQLSCDPAHKDKMVDYYLPSILKFYYDMLDKKTELRLYSYEGLIDHWKSVKFDHPFTFDVLALDPELKRAVIDDVDRFIKRKEFYKKVGKAWKRGYLLYGPPGTGKSSLVAAMANYLEFDIFDLQLSSVNSDSVLRRLLLTITNKSILVIEDIDCCLGSAVGRRSSKGGRRSPKGKGEDATNKDSDTNTDTKISLSGLLNIIDGLWSSCGDERIIIFTTNHKDELDPALLRPGRMDMHIQMSYLTMPAFRVLASNYLDVTGEHPLFGEIEQLIQATNVTPAQVAEELIRSDDAAGVALSNLIEMLKRKIQYELNKKQETEDCQETNCKVEKCF